MRREYGWCWEAWEKLKPLIPPGIDRPIRLFIGPKTFEDQIWSCRGQIEYFERAYHIHISTRWCFPLNAWTKSGCQHLFAHEIGHAIHLDGKDGKKWLEALAEQHPKQREACRKMIADGLPPRHFHKELLVETFAEVFFPYWLDEPEED